MWARRVALVLLPLVLLAAAAWTLHVELRGMHLRDVGRELDVIARGAVLAAALVTALDYLLLSAYDLLALRYAGRSLPYPRVVFTSFIAYAFGNNVGVALLSSGSVRYRLYAQWGLSAEEIARIVAFTAGQLWAGLLPIVGVALLAGVPVPLPDAVARALGVASLAIVGAYLAFAARGRRRELTVRGLSFPVPSLGLALAQVAISAADWALAALVLHLLLPPGSPLSFPQLLGLFVAAQVAGLASQVPGGLGVFDAVIVAALTPAVPAPAVLGSLVLYRAIYYLAPFAAAFALLAGHEVVLRRAVVRRVLRGAHASFSPVVPWLAAAGALLAGTVLLLSGATPTVTERLHLLRRMVPLPVLEASHLVGSLVGTALLLLARGLARRLDGAWVAALGCLVAGAVASLAKGLDWEEATLLLGLAVLLLPFRRQFYRRSSLLDGRLIGPWIAAVLVLLAASTAVGFLAYRHVEYSSDLWFRFAFHADAPRFLRASMGAASLVVLWAVAKLLRPTPPEPPLPGEAELSRVRPLVDRSPDSSAHLALVGDKPLLLDESGTAFVMYGVEGRCWVAMGDPVGPDPAATELAWRFREMSDRHGGLTCFYQVGPDALPRYLDLGLALLKLGEEALVPLEGFTLEGGERRSLRQMYNRAVREGLVFDVVPAAGVAPLLPELRRVSDAWLAEKDTREKGFSLGYFEPRYLCEGPIAVARKDGAIQAFANLWTSSCKVELSLDLMRHLPDAPRGTMEFLFVSMMSWGKTEGYRRFNLGMAPFSGFEERSLSPLWTRIAARLYRHGEHFYNFQGLRAFKEKFAPDWRPRWLAAPGGLRLATVLTGVAALVSRGLKGVVSR
jgi:phosphatidylglycerol lysyltransferase